MKKINNNQKNIQSFLIKVDEEIEKKNLNKFIHSSLELKGIKIEKRVKIIYSFLFEIKSYQIIIYNNNAKDFMSILYSYANNRQNNGNIVVYKNDIYLFRNGQFYYFQKLDYVLSKNEIQELIAGKLKLLVENIVFINDIKIQKDNFDKNKFSKNVNILKRNNFSNILVFGIFTSLVFLFFSVFLIKNNYKNNSIKNSVEKKEFELEKLIESKQRDLQIISLIILFENIKKLSLVLTDLSYENKLYTLVLESSKEKSLYKLMSFYKKSVKLNKIQYLPERKKYELHIQIRDY